MIFDKEDFKAYDADLWNAIAKEEERQQNNIELIASENVVSKAVMAAQGSILTNKYAEGYPGRRYYGGTDVVDVVDEAGFVIARGLARCSAESMRSGKADVAVHRDELILFE